MHTDFLLQAFLGGGLIGLGAFILMLSNGRIAGISGIVYGAISNSGKSNLWRWYFLAGLVIAPLLTTPFGFSLPDTFAGSFNVPADSFFTRYLVIILGGLLVGFGTNLGSGCTSGHGICGISRLSSRSILATAIFLLSAIITVTIIKHVLGSL